MEAGTPVFFDKDFRVRSLSLVSRFRVLPIFNSIHYLFGEAPSLSGLEPMNVFRKRLMGFANDKSLAESEVVN